MGNNPNTSRQGESIDDCELHRSERNRYFHGKLMSARDMQAEQRYYRGLFTRHARQVTGQGVVSGLEVTLNESEDDDAFDVELQPGYAVDCCGRPVVVPNVTSLTVEPDDDVDEGPVWISLAYEECVRETVPVPNSEDACEQECEYNRILEVFEIRIEPPDPERSPSKPVPSIEFPSKDAVENDEDAALDTISREYESQKVPVGCQDGGGHTVFLGRYTKRGDNWEREDEQQARSRVHSNDMLYAGLARHTANFRNPHEVSLRTEQANGGALLGNEHDDTPEADVRVASPDSTLTINVDETDQRIDLNMGEAIERLIQHRLDPLEAYFVDRVFKYTHQTFTRYLASPEDEFQPYTYGNMTKSLATQIAEADADRDDELVPRIRTTAKAVIAQSSRIEFPEIDDELAVIQEFEDAFVNVAEDFVTEDSHSRLEEASGALEDAVDGLQGEGTATLSDVAAAQNAYCQAVVLLESAREEEEAVVSFARNVHRVDRGDFADITVELDGDVDDVEVTVGSEEMKYEAVLEVEPAGAEEFTITMNTFLAGNATNAQLGLGYAEPPDNETTEGVWSIDSPTGDATIQDAELRTDELNAILDTGGYDLSVGFEGSVEDEAVLTVQDRVTDDHTVWTAPHTRQLREELAGAEVDTGEVLDAFEITDRDRVAVTDGERDARPRGDWAIHRIAVTGVYGAIDELEIETLEDLVRLEERLDVRLFAFGYEQTDPPGDQAPLVLHTSNGNLEAFPVFVDSDDGSLFVALDSSRIEVVPDREQAQPRPLRHELESEYEATFTVDSPYLNLFTLEDEELDPEDVSDTVAFVDRWAEFDTNDDNIIVVERAEAQEIAGETSIAPGTTVSVRARETDVAPFLMTTDVAVDAEGRFAGEFDFTEQEPEIDFTVSIPDQSFEDDAETTGHISGE